MNKLKICTRIASMVLVIPLSACSLFGLVPGSGYLVGDDGAFRDRQGDYLSAETIPRTQIPDGLDGYIIDDLLIIPELPAGGDAFLQVPRPQPTIGENERGVVIQRINDASWIIVDASPSQVWPRVRDYWRSSGIDITNENPTEGIMETDWFTLTNNILTREKFKVTVEPGFQDDSSEIKLLHLAMPQATPIFDRITTNWPEASNDLELEQEILNALSVYLVDVSNLYAAGSVSFLAGSISTDGKANLLTTPGGREVLRLEADYQRSWAAVGRALQRAEVEVLNQDQVQGVYEVDYIIPQVEGEGPGFLTKIITINGLLSSDADQYHSLKIQLLESAGGVDVLIENMDADQDQGDADDEAESSLLQTIRDFIA